MNSRQEQMLLTAEQHQRIAERYRRPDADWTPEEVAKAHELAGYHEALAKLATAASP